MMLRAASAGTAATAGRMTFGLEADLGILMDDALDNMVMCTSVPSGVDTLDALACMTVDWRVTPVSNRTRRARSGLAEGILL
jgi:hypothetical protein